MMPPAAWVSETPPPVALAHRRILFVIPPTGAYCREDRCQSWFSPELVPSMRPPMEECEAAGALRAVGAQVAVIDAPAAGLASADVLRRLQRFSPDLLVITVTFGSLEDDLRWAARVREVCPSLPIGLRGAPCYVEPEALLARAPVVDFCVRGEYELVFADIARQGLRLAAGTVHRNGERIVANPIPLASDLDALARPDRSVIDPARYTVRGLGAPQATVRVQRGCPFPCSYCLVHLVSGDRARHRSPASIAAEMEELTRSGIRFFYLRAETCTLDRRWALQVCEAIAARCPQARWVTTTRVECVDDGVLEAMSRAGCYGISFGIDAASAAVGARVDKRPDGDRAHAAMRLCDRYGIVSLAYLMIGFLWDTPATLAETEALLHHVRPDLLTVHFAHPYPGTRYHAQVAAERLALASPHAQAEPALALPELSPAHLRRFARAMTRRHYTQPRVLASLARKSLHHGVNWLTQPRNGSSLPFAISANHATGSGRESNDRSALPVAVFATGRGPARGSEEPLV